MTLSARFSAAVAALTLATVSLLHAQDITNKDLLDGLANPSRWLTHSGDYAGARVSPLTQITPATASQPSGNSPRYHPEKGFAVHWNGNRLRWAFGAEYTSSLDRLRMM